MQNLLEIGPGRFVRHTQVMPAHTPTRPQLALVPPSLRIDRSRDALLTDFGKDTLNDRYLLPGESYQDLFARVARQYADDPAHAQRLYDYMSKLWFMPATPILSNGGAGRGLPISCFLNSVNDSLDGIVGTWNENVFLASNGGGIGTYWGGVRSIGEPVKGSGQTSGIIPFLRVMDSLTLAISQGSLRRGSAAVYLDVHHPEIEFQSATTARATWALEDQVIETKAQITIRGAAFYHDEYVKQDGVWLIRSTGYERTFEEMESRKDHPSLRLTQSAWEKIES